MDELIAFVMARLGEDECMAGARAHLAAMTDGWDRYNAPEGVHDPDGRLRHEALVDMLRDIYRGVAALWSDHPDYRDAWKPDAPS